MSQDNYRAEEFFLIPHGNTTLNESIIEDPTKTSIQTRVKTPITFDYPNKSHPIVK